MSYINEGIMEAVTDGRFQKMQAGVGAFKLNGPSVDRDPDSIENLVAQVVAQISDNKSIVRGLRAEYLGPWPEEEKTLNAIGGIHNKTDGLIGQLRQALYIAIDDNREIKEHIVMISKGVR